MIRVVESINPEDIQFIRDWAESFKVKDFDTENHKIVITLDKGMSEKGMMEEGMMGDWLVKHGFNVSFEVKDVEYTTKGTFDPRSITNYRGHQAFLRNRTVLTITW